MIDVIEIHTQIDPRRVVGIKEKFRYGAENDDEVRHAILLRQKHRSVHIEKARLAIAEPGMHQPFDARTRPSVERPLHRLIERGEVLVTGGRRVFTHRKSLLHAIDDARMNAPASFPGPAHIDVRLLSEKLGDGFDIEFGARRLCSGVHVR